MTSGLSLSMSSARLALSAASLTRQWPMLQRARAMWPSRVSGVSLARAWYWTAELGTFSRWVIWSLAMVTVAATALCFTSTRRRISRVVALSVITSPVTRSPETRRISSSAMAARGAALQARSAQTRLAPSGRGGIRITHSFLTLAAMGSAAPPRSTAHRRRPLARLRHQHPPAGDPEAQDPPMKSRP